jgi:predicted benzoate:H+ symporter BenE
MGEGRYEGQPNAGAGSPGDSSGLTIVQRQDRFSARRGEHEIALARTTAEMQRAAEDARHQRQEAARDNTQRRILIYIVVGVVIAGLVAATLVGTWADNDDTRRWAQGIVTLLLGGLLGAVGGYFSAKPGK